MITTIANGRVDGIRLPNPVDFPPLAVIGFSS